MRERFGMINSFTTHHLFQNRLYLSPLDEKRIKRSIFSKNGSEYKGAGIKSYAKPIGYLLSLVGVSSKLKIGNKIFYIDNKSFSKFIIRSSEIGNVVPCKEVASRFHLLYEKHQKTGYDKNKLDLINGRLKQLIYKNLNIKKMVNSLKNVASHEY
jgi:hypothetical protein